MFRILHKIAVPGMAAAQRRNDFLPRERLADLQWRKLKKLLRIAYDRAPFYRRRFKEIGARPEDIRTPEDFARIPLLTRDDLLNHGHEMLTSPRETLRQDRSGGSTGHPVFFYYDHAYKYLGKALRRRFESWIGAAGQRPFMYLWGITMKPNVPAVIRPWHRLFLPGFRFGFGALDDDILSSLVREFIRIKPAVIYGYASLLGALAARIKDDRVVVYPPKLVISTAETLLPDNRVLMEEAFRAPVYNFYGSHENLDIAGECRERQGLHVAADHVFLEILAGGGAAEPGEPGYLVVTDLDNHAMPFIRYRNEDIGAWSARDACPCGRSLPRLESVHGRDTDFVYDRDGVAYPGINLMRYVRPMAEGGRVVRQFQFIQTERGRLRLLAVPGPDYGTGVEAALLLAMGEAFHHKMEVTLALVDRIQPEPSGKTRFVKSTIPYRSVWGDRY